MPKNENKSGFRKIDDNSKAGFLSGTGIRVVDVDGEHESKDEYLYRSLSFSVQ